MDGFTVSNSQKFLETGQLRTTDSSLRSQRETAGPTSTDSTAKSFADTLKEAVGEVNQLQKTSDKMMQNLATGRTDNVADVMIASEKADIALRVMVQVRNKVIDAYNEIMKMQV